VLKKEQINWNTLKGEKNRKTFAVCCRFDAVFCSMCSCGTVCCSLLQRVVCEPKVELLMARSREDKTRNGLRNAKRNANWNQQTNFRGLFSNLQMKRRHASCILGYWEFTVQYSHETKKFHCSALASCSHCRALAARLLQIDIVHQIKLMTCILEHFTENPCSLERPTPPQETPVL